MTLEIGAPMMEWKTVAAGWQDDLVGGQDDCWGPGLGRVRRWVTKKNDTCMQSCKVVILGSRWMKHQENHEHNTCMNPPSPFDRRDGSGLRHSGNALSQHYPTSNCEASTRE